MAKRITSEQIATDAAGNAATSVVITGNPSSLYQNGAGLALQTSTLSNGTTLNVYGDGYSVKDPNTGDLIFTPADSTGVGLLLNGEGATAGNERAHTLAWNYDQPDLAHDLKAGIDSVFGTSWAKPVINNTQQTELTALQGATNTFRENLQDPGKFNPGMAELANVENSVLAAGAELLFSNANPDDRRAAVTAAAAGGDILFAIGAAKSDSTATRYLGNQSFLEILEGAGGAKNELYITKSTVSQEHIDELVANGIKFTPQNVLATGKNSDGQVVFLESGSAKGGLAHIVEGHAQDFANIGVPENQIPDLVMHAVTQGTLVDYQGRGTGRGIYQTTLNGQIQNIAVSVGTNGFIVGANPIRGGK